jgi:hypothetical protein
LLADKLAPAPVPVPVRATDCGLPFKLSAIEMVAARTPVPVGVNFTISTQLAFGGIVLPQLFVSEKSLALVPVIEMPLSVKLADPVFVTVTVCTALLVPTL